MWGAGEKLLWRGVARAAVVTLQCAPRARAMILMTRQLLRKFPKDVPFHDDQM